MKTKLCFLMGLAFLLLLNAPAHAIDYQDIEVTDTDNLYHGSSKRSNHRVEGDTNITINIQDRHGRCSAPGWPSKKLYFGKPELFNKIPTREMWFCVSNPYKSVVLRLTAFGKKNGDASIELLDSNFNVVDFDSSDCSFTGTRKVTRFYDTPDLEVGQYYVKVYNLSHVYDSVRVEIAKGRY